MIEEIKSSNIKPNFEFGEVDRFACINLGSIEEVSRLREGHTSQVFVFKHEGGNKRVLRIAPNNTGFIKDKYAFDNFSSAGLPIPEIFDLGSFKDGSYYCVSQFVEGKASDQLSAAEMSNSLDAQLSCFAQLFRTNITGADGWGEIDIATWVAPYDNWQDSIKDEITDLDESLMLKGLESLGLDKSLFRRFKNQFEVNMSQLSNPMKRLVHGDLGFDNVLIHDGRVVAVIDWGDMGYGDWIFDMARCDFWHPGKYGDIREFGQEFNLDFSMVAHRIKACTSFVALTTLDYAIRYESDSTKSWLKKYLPSRIG
jgi:hygromycin-B 4-O-kinase